MTPPAPDTLRELPDAFDTTLEVRDLIHVHADAWELREMALKAALEENANLYRRLEAIAFEATGYLDVVNRRKQPEASAVVSVGFIRRAAAIAKSGETPYPNYGETRE